MTTLAVEQDPSLLASKPPQDEIVIEELVREEPKEKPLSRAHLSHPHLSSPDDVMVWCNG